MIVKLPGPSCWYISESRRECDCVWDVHWKYDTFLTNCKYCIWFFHQLTHTFFGHTHLYGIRFLEYNYFCSQTTCSKISFIFPFWPISYEGDRYANVSSPYELPLKPVIQRNETDILIPKLARLSLFSLLRIVAEIFVVIHNRRYSCNFFTRTLLVY